MSSRTAAAVAVRSFEDQLDSLPLNRRHWLVFGMCAAGFFFDSVDLQIMSLVTPVLRREWSLSPFVLGVVAAAALFGMLCGSLLFGPVADRMGRRPVFQLTVAVFATFSGFCALARGPADLVVYRFCVGLGLGGFTAVVATIMAEFVPLRSRGRMVALWAVAFPVGGLAATSLVRSLLPAFGWRAMFLIGVAPAVMVLVVRVLMPETPRYLMSRGRYAEAERSAAWLAGGPPRESTAPELPASSGVTADAPALLARPVARGDGNPVAKLFSTEHRRGTTVAWLMSASWSFAAFGTILWLPTLLTVAGYPLDTVFRYTLGFQAAAVLGRLTLLVFVDRVGRRAIVVVAGLAAAVLASLFGISESWLWLVVTGWGLSFFADGGLSGIVPYTPELYPTDIRSTGVGWASGMGRAGSLLASLLVGPLVAVGSRHVVLTVFAGCYVCASAIVACFGRETAGRLPAQAESDAQSDEVAGRDRDSRTTTS